MVDVLRMDYEAVAARIAAKFGGNLAAVSRNWPTEDPPHRSTVQRWLKQETLPRSARELLAFSAALDLDPFALWGVSPATFPHLCERLVKASRMRSWTDVFHGLSFLAEFVGPTPEWPPADLARTYFHREWVIRDFSHPARDRRNYFATIVIKPDRRCSTWSADQVWHFAWRDAIEHALWRPYGFVRLAGPELRLFSFNGLSDSAKVNALGSSFLVETWFGEGAAVFCVASLHPFELELSDIAQGERPRVRFGFP